MYVQRTASSTEYVYRKQLLVVIFWKRVMEIAAPSRIVCVVCVPNRHYGRAVRGVERPQALSLHD